MKILVDYDNIPQQLKRHGSVYITDRIMTAMRPLLPPLGIERIDFRLYGGWYESNMMSRAAQQLSVELKAAFPRSFNLEHSDPPRPVSIAAMLAQSLEVLPATVLVNTVRRIPVEKEFSCRKATDLGCKKENCPVDPLSTFLGTGHCPVVGCVFTPRAVLTKMEQKLVDTMMVADMIYLAKNGESAFAVVSSDDDMWPGIISALVAGTELIHVQTSGMKTSLPYKRNVKGKYQQVEI